MSAHIVDKLLFLVIIVAAARVLWCFYPYRQVVVEEDSREVVAPEVQPEAVQQQMDAALVSSEREQVTASEASLHSSPDCLVGLEAQGLFG